MPPSSTPPLAAGTPALGWDDHRPFVGSPVFSPLDRLTLVRADGSMHPVTPGSLAGVPRIYCAIHGWAPGSQAAADLIRAQTGRQPLAWDDGMVDLYGISIAEEFMPLLSAIAEKDPEAAVLWFSWVDESATSGEVFAGRQSLSHTQINGARLAMALVAAASADMPPVQLIGHSHGCVVATHAALALPAAPAQLTLLDCPEDWFSRAGGAAGLLADVLPRLEPGRDPGRVLVDSYTSMFGRPYHRHPGLSDVVDVRLAGGSRRRERGAVGDAHAYALQWYAETVRQPAPRSGFGWSVIAARRGDEADPGAFDPQRLAAEYVVNGGRSPVVLFRRPEVPTRPHHESIPLPVGELDLTPDRPDVVVSVPLSAADLIEFDYRIARAARPTRVQGAVGRTLAFSGASGDFEVPAAGRYLRIPGSRDTSVPVMIQFRLVDPDPDSVATIRDLRAVRTGTRTRNYDSTRTAAAIGLAGVVVGSAATLAAQAVSRGIRARMGARRALGGS